MAKREERTAKLALSLTKGWGLGENGSLSGVVRRLADVAGWQLARRVDLVLTFQ